jgi:plasmid replication initiation protein
MSKLEMPQTMEEIMLIQPNNVTFGQYSLSPIQENVMTLIMDALQNHMSKHKDLPKDLFNQPYVEILCDEAGKENNKSAVKRAVKDMYKKEFCFKWVHPQIHKTIASEGTIINTMHDIEGTNKIVINFNAWAIPFLVYYGVGVGGTIFNKSIALNLRGDYPKRIYKIICRWKDKPSFNYSINQLRKDLELPDSYDNNLIEKRVLKPTVEKIKESGSEVWFEYELLCLNPQKGRKPKADTILFYIKHINPQKVGGVQYEKYKFVYEWLRRIWDNTQSSKAQEILDKLCEIGGLDAVYKRADYYDKQVVSGSITTLHAVNKLKKMLKEEYKFD